MERRRLRVEYIDPELTRLCDSLDYRVPSLELQYQGRSWLPFGFIVKGDGRLCDFDLKDSAGQSLPLLRREDNARWSAKLLIAAARRYLGDESYDQHRLVIDAELARIAGEHPDDAVGVLVERWGAIAALNQVYGWDLSDVDGWRRSLVLHEEFGGLLSELATSSLVMLHVPRDARVGDRLLAKLSYTMVENDMNVVVGLRRSRFRGLLVRLGLSSKLSAVYVPWVGAPSFHAEFHAPRGIKLVSGGIGPRRHDRALSAHREHVYSDSLSADGPAAPAVRMRAAGAALGAPAVGMSVIVLLAVLACILEAGWIEPRVGEPAPSVILAGVAFISGLMARPTHEVARHLMLGPRLALSGVAIVAFALAARFALTTPEAPIEASEIENLGYITLPVAALSVIFLLAVRIADWYSQSDLLWERTHWCWLTGMGIGTGIGCYIIQPHRAVVSVASGLFVMLAVAAFRISPRVR